MFRVQMPSWAIFAPSLSGYRISKDGRLVPGDKHLNVSLRLKQQSNTRRQASARQPKSAMMLATGRCVASRRTYSPAPPPLGFPAPGRGAEPLPPFANLELYTATRPMP